MDDKDQDDDEENVGDLWDSRSSLLLRSLRSVVSVVSICITCHHLNPALVMHSDAIKQSALRCVADGLHNRSVLCTAHQLSRDVSWVCLRLDPGQNPRSHALALVTLYSNLQG